MSAGRRSAIIVPVPEAAPIVDAWRLRYTSDAPAGVPAHITVLFPFVPAARLDRAIEEQLEALLRPQRAFEFALATTARFAATVYLEPEPPEPFVRLTDLIATAYPDHPPYEGAFDAVVPHLTVAQSEDEALLKRIAADVEAKLPVRARVSAASLIEEGPDGRWRERFPLPFRGTAPP